MSDDFDTPTILTLKPVNDDLEDAGPGRIQLVVQGARRGVNATRDFGSATLDTLGLPFVAPAARWKTAADRRADMRTDEARDALMDANRAHRDTGRDLRRDRKAHEKARSEVAWWNVFNGERRAAYAVVRDSRQLHSEARRDRRAARKAYPLALPQLAVRCHAVALGVTGFWDLVSDSALADAGLVTAVAAAAFNAVAIPLGLRHVSRDTTDPELDALRPTKEELDLLHVLDPKLWQRYAAPRGLEDVQSASATLTESGIQAKLTLNGTMDLAKLRKLEAQLRAALRLREGVRMELREGSTGGHARLTIRTRSKSDGVVMTGWKPGDAWAVDTVTGETVPVPLGKRILFAGTSGAGKSWSARPLMAEASEYEDHRLVIFDRKHVEARNWEHRARTACELDDMYDLCDELTAEGESRLKKLPRGEDVVQISPSMPRITVFVDEGGELLSDCKGKDKDSGRDYADVIATLRTIARKYRAAEIILVWCTQKPSLTGDGHGLDSQVAGQMTVKLSLALATANDTMVVFGNDAVEKGWKANELPMPGYALLRDQELGPKQNTHTLKMRAMSPKDVISLPDRPIWSRQVSSTGATAQDIQARQQLEAAAQAAGSDPWTGVTVTDSDTIDLTKVPVSSADRDDQILAELHREPCRTIGNLAKVLGVNKGTVKKRLDQMEADGIVAKDDDGCWHPVV